MPDDAIAQPLQTGGALPHACGHERKRPDVRADDLAYIRVVEVVAVAPGAWRCEVDRRVGVEDRTGETRAGENRPVHEVVVEDEGPDEQERTEHGCHQAQRPPRRDRGGRQDDDQRSERGGDVPPTASGRIACERARRRMKLAIDSLWNRGVRLGGGK